MQKITSLAIFLIIILIFNVIFIPPVLALNNLNQQNEDNDNNFLWQGLLLLLLAFLLEWFTGEEDPVPEPEPPPEPDPEPEPDEKPEDPDYFTDHRLGFYVNWENGENSSWDSLHQKHTALTSVAPLLVFPERPIGNNPPLRWRSS